VKKTGIFLVFLILAALSSFAADVQERSLYIDGRSDDREQMLFFWQHFLIEARGFGYTVVSRREDAQFTLKFEVFPNVIVYNDRTVGEVPSDAYQYHIRLTFIKNEGNAEQISFSCFFSDLEYMNEYTQLLFSIATNNVTPGAIQTQQVRIEVGEQEEEEEEQEEEEEAPVQEDAWRNKVLYLRISFDFPFTVYQLNDNNLIAGRGVYDGEKDAPDRVAPIDNRFVALPAMTLGIELQFLNWMSIEAKFQAGFDYMNGTEFFYFAPGVELKIPLKFMRNIMFEPYGAVSMPILIREDIFAEFPQFGYGGGFQISTYGGKAGAVFIDINYMYFGDTGIKNHYRDLYPTPDVIHFQRSVIGLGVGYKFGLGNRRARNK
jgi:hypothetical protein